MQLRKIFKGRIFVHVIRDYDSSRSKKGPHGFKLKAHVSTCVQTIMEKEVHALKR